MGGCSAVELPLQAFDQIGLPLAAIADFVSDVWVNLTNAQSDDDVTKLLGFIGILSMGVSVLVNLVLAGAHIVSYKAFYLSYVWPLCHMRPIVVFFFLLASTSLESMNLFYTAFWGIQWCLRQNLDEHVVTHMEVARLRITRWVLWSQLFEDVPELFIQTLAIISTQKAQKVVTWLQIVSVATTFCMLFGKLLKNILANAIKVDYSVSIMRTIIDQAEEQGDTGRAESPLKRLFYHPGTSLVHALSSVLVLIVGGWSTTHMVFLAAKGAMQAGVGDHTPLLISIYSTTACGLLFVACYLPVVTFLGAEEDYTWHVAASMGGSTVCAVLAVFSPTMVYTIHPALPNAIFRYCAGWAAAGRALFFLVVLAVGQVKPIRSKAEQAADGSDRWLHASSEGSLGSLNSTGLVEYYPRRTAEDMLRSLWQSAEAIPLIFANVLVILVTFLLLRPREHQQTARDLAASQSLMQEEEEEKIEGGEQPVVTPRPAVMTKADMMKRGEREMENLAQEILVFLDKCKDNNVPDQEFAALVKRATDRLRRDNDTLAQLQQRANARAEALLEVEQCVRLAEQAHTKMTREAAWRAIKEAKEKPLGIGDERLREYADRLHRLRRLGACCSVM